MEEVIYLTNFSSIFDGNSSDGWNLTMPRPPLVYPRGVTILAGVSAIICFIIGVPGNTITIIALCKSRTLMKNTTSWFVINLCVTDLMFCISFLPLIASRYLRDEWVHGEAACRIMPFFLYVNEASSMLGIGAVTINRYIRIRHHFLYEGIFTPMNVRIMLGILWGFTITIMALPLAGVWGAFGWDAHRRICTILLVNNRSPKVFIYAFFFVIPCMIIITCYTLIFLYVRRSRRTLEAFKRGSDKDRSQPKILNFGKEDMQMTKMILLIFGLFLVCYLPIVVVSILKFDEKHPWSFVIGSILVMLTSCTNLISYVLCNVQYRKAYMELWALCRPAHFERFLGVNSESYSRSDKHITVISKAPSKYNAAV